MSITYLDIPCTIKGKDHNRLLVLGIVNEVQFYTMSLSLSIFLLLQVSRSHICLSRMSFTMTPTLSVAKDFFKSSINSILLLNRSFAPDLCTISKEV